MDIYLGVREFQQQGATAGGLQTPSLALPEHRHEITDAIANSQSGTFLPQSDAARHDAGAIRPFHVHFPHKDLDDLRRRINATKWPERETVTDQSQGVQLATMQKLARWESA